jgi:hypothetical protein
MRKYRFPKLKVETFMKIFRSLWARPDVACIPFLRLSTVQDMSRFMRCKHKRAARLVLCATLAWGCGANAAPVVNPLPDYAALEQALVQGASVSAQIDLSRCRTKDGDQAGPDVHGGMHIHSYLVGPDHVIAFIDVHRTLDAQYRKMTEYVRYSVSLDQSVMVRIASAAEPDASAKPRGEYRCVINQGIRFFVTSSR